MPRQVVRNVARTLAGNVAIEMTIAGAQVLREQFGFTAEQATRWVDATVAQAKENREA